MSTFKRRPHWHAEQMHTFTQAMEAIAWDLDQKRQQHHNDLRAVCAYLHKMMPRIRNVIIEVDTATNFRNFRNEDAKNAWVVYTLINEIRIKNFVISQNFVLDVCGRYLDIESGYEHGRIRDITGRWATTVALSHLYNGTNFQYPSHTGPPITIKEEQETYKSFNIPWPNRK